MCTKYIVSVHVKEYDISEHQTQCYSERINKLHNIEDFNVLHLFCIFSLLANMLVHVGLILAAHIRPTGICTLM